MFHFSDFTQLKKYEQVVKIEINEGAIRRVEACGTKTSTSGLQKRFETHGITKSLPCDILYISLGLFGENNIKHIVSGKRDRKWLNKVQI